MWAQEALIMDMVPYYPSPVLCSLVRSASSAQQPVTTVDGVIDYPGNFALYPVHRTYI